ncbi:MAG: hypothetical protein P9L97_09345 [Candidatus Tenebribacter davisii]|nr:hypothetical protein [Candidatus Tenebribacter davisii]
MNKKSRLSYLATSMSKDGKKSVSVFKNKGFILENPVIYKPVSHKIVKRGIIGGFSRGSSRRMRKVLLTKSFREDFYYFGITLTIPGYPLNFKSVSALFKRFSNYSLRLPFEFVAVWRMEVQKRGSIHWHLIAGCDCSEPSYIIDQIKKVWLKCLSGVGNISVEFSGSLSEPDEVLNSNEFYNYWEFISDTYGEDSYILYEKACKIAIFETQTYGNWIRYIYDHATKKKNAQVASGFGRHWGIINRKYLVDASPDEFMLSDRQFYKIVRWYHRLATSSRSNDNSCFGRSLGKNYKSRGKAGRSCFFANPETVLKMIDFLHKNHD